MERPSHFSTAEWNEMCKQDTPDKDEQIEIKIPFRLQQRARNEFGLKFNPQTKTNYYTPRFASHYQKKYITTFNKYSTKLNEKLNWDNDQKCYFYFAFEEL